MALSNEQHDRLILYLRQVLPGCRKEDTIQLQAITFGQSNPTYAVSVRSMVSGRSADAPSWIVRSKPAGAHIASAHAVDREFRVMSALSRAGVAVPVPRCLCFEAASVVLGVPFYVMTFVSGRIFKDPSLPRASPSYRRAVYRNALQVLAALHRVDVAAVGLADFAPEGDYYSRQLKRLVSVSNAQAAALPHPLPAMAEIVAALSSRLPPSERVLIHGDYKIDNIVFHPESGEVRGVLDWEMSTLGHPMSDVANMCVAYLTPHVDAEDDGDDATAHVEGHKGGGRKRSRRPMNGLAGVDLGWDTTGIPSEDELVSMYCSLARRPYPDPHWHFYKAFFLFKYAVIAQGIAARIARGGTSGGASAAAGAMAPHLMRMAGDALDVAMPQHDDES